MKDKDDWSSFDKAVGDKFDEYYGSTGLRAVVVVPIVLVCALLILGLIGYL